MKIIKNARIKDYTTYKLSGIIKEVVYPENTEERRNKKAKTENDIYCVLCLFCVKVIMRCR